MAYRIRYEAYVDWVGPGQGPMGAGSTPLTGGVGGAGGAQTKYFGNTSGYPSTNVVGTGAGGIIAAADITVLTNAMAADIAAQMNVPANLAVLQGFASGGG